MIYDPQKMAAEAILNHYKTNRSGLLRANEQAGKTGAYHYLIQLMFLAKLIERVYILCGSSETELRDQCSEDVKKYHLDPDHRKNIHVMFRQDFSKKTNPTMNMNKALIIVDESHLVEGVNQTLSKFLKRHNISMAGTTDNMLINQTYMLSVDATPYAEESAMIHGLSHKKFKVTMEDGEGYYGIRQYDEDKFIQPTYELITEDGKNTFVTQLKNCPRKYILIRVQEAKNKNVHHMMECAQRAGCDIKYFNSKYTGRATQICITNDDKVKHLAKYKQTIPCLEDAPEKTTIIFIDGRLRCGKRVPKKHIGFVWESSKKSKTDIIRQSLPGRMCGRLGDGLYDVHVNKENRPRIFVPFNILKRNENTVLPLSDLERSCRRGWLHRSNETDVTPRFATNILPGSLQKIAKRGNEIVTQCPPIKFRLDPEQISALDSLNVKEYCFNKFLEEDLITNAHLTDAQKLEIRNWLDSARVEDCHKRMYEASSSEPTKNAHKTQVEGHETHSAASEHINGGTNPGFLTFCVFYPGFVPHVDVQNKSQPGDVYAIFYTKAGGEFQHINQPSRISRVNNNTHFTIHPTDIMQQVVAASSFGFTEDILRDSSELYKQFDYFIEIAKKGIGIFDRTFKSLHNGQCIKLPYSVYGNDKHTLRRMKADLEEKHSVVITYKFIKQPIVPDTPLTYHKVKSISWEHK